MNTQKKDYTLSSVRNALRILRSFSMDEPEKKLNDLSDQLGISKSAVSRLLQTLASEGFITKVAETKSFRLGPSVLGLNSIFTANLEIRNVAIPSIHNLVETLKEAAYLATIEGEEVIYLFGQESKQPLRIQSHVGKRTPLYCTGSGKAMLAYNEELIEKVIAKGLHKHAKNTITDPKKLRQHLKEVKKQGFAHESDEFIDGIASISAPIRNYRNKVVAAVTIVAPSQRLHKHLLPIFSKKIIQASIEISEKIGYINSSKSFDLHKS